jgi:hypothetical protein
MKKRFKIVSFTLLLISVFLSVLLILLIVENDKHESAKAYLQTQNDSLIQQMNKLELILEAENLFIEGEFDSAMKIYKSFSLLENDSLFYKKRINVISEYSRLQNEFFESENISKIEINNLKKMLSQEIELIELSYEHRLDSIQHLFNNTISTMRNELKSKQQMIDNAPQISELVFYSVNGARTIYFGEVSGQKANGKGMAYYSSGSIYIGPWKNNLKHGKKGSYRWLDGDRYEGEYVDGKRKGNGTYFWANGEKYEGEWENDKRNGVGVLYDAENNIKLKGNWKNDELLKAIE